MRKLWLTFTAMLLCSIVSFAQTQPTQLTQANFVSAIKANPSGSFILTEDINLGTYDAESNNFVIESFSGTFDGNDNTITYQGSFTATDSAKIGLFRIVSGTIKNLNLDADITVGGGGSNVKVGLLCGEFQHNTTAETVIEFCDVTGNINSTVKAGTIGHASTGLIIGSNLDTLRYCTGHGNITGVGYVGGLVGSMGTVAEDNNYGSFLSQKFYKPLIRGCYFTGNVTANNSSTGAAQLLEGIVGAFGGDVKLQSFAGGICGTMRKPAKIELCVAEAIIVVGQNAGGITNTTLGGGDCDVNNNYCTGSVNGATVTNSNIVSTIIGNPTDNNNPNYCGNTGLQTIVDNLNAKRCPNENNCDENFYFAVINGKVVLIVGEITEYVCDAPIGLTVTTGENGTFTAYWSVNNQDATVNETTFRYTLTNNGTTIQEGTTTNTTANGTLPAETTPYTLTIESDCSASQNGLYSDAITYTFYVNANCPSVSGLQVTNITPNTAKVSWTGTANIVELNGEGIELTSGETLTGLTPATNYIIEAIVYCEINGQQVERPTTVTFTTEVANYVTAQSGPFYTTTTWVGGKVPTGNPGTTITISDGHKVNLDGTLVLYGTIINNGVLVIPQSSGQLINMTENDVSGIVEIDSDNKTNGEWTFIGAPFGNANGNANDGYTLGTILPVSGSDISVSKYDYLAADWSDSWAHVGTRMEAGEGYFAWPFYGGVVTYTTYGDVCTWDANANNGEGAWVNNGYKPNQQPETALNNADFTIKKTIKVSPNGGYWMALSNPYPATLSVSRFLSQNSGIQGNCTYRLNGTTWEIQNATSGDIELAEGFFLNVVSEGEKTINFSKTQLKDYPTQPQPAKSQVAPREFVELSLVKGNYESKLYFAHNQEAEQNYDIFDANKLFALGEVAEPYFVTDGIALVKEEVAELPYYATMNVRSFANDTVSFVVNNIPEGLAVSIIDGENIIDMVEGGVYTTEILTGENADRFKVLIKKSVSISDVEELEVNITNNNRHISIETTETDLQVEVYNALGQKVLSTKDRNFTLNQVSAGAYLIKAFNNKASKTQKIVVE